MNIPERLGSRFTGIFLLLTVTFVFHHRGRAKLRWSLDNIRGHGNGQLRYLFEDYVLDTDRREVRRGPAVIPIRPQVFDLLEHLIRNRERVVSKDDLIATIWGGRIVSESALTTRINAVRCAIGDNGEEQRLIKTLPRKGFRFVAAVREEQEPVDTVRATIPADTSTSTLAYPDRPSIAVLPFTNISGDPEQEYFADGVVEEITTALSRFSGLFVIARNSSFTYKGRAVEVKQVGRELGVRYILEGSVRRSGQRVRITGQLIDAASGAHLWADRFEGELADIFALQDQVAASVVGAITPKLERLEIERAKHMPTESQRAYDYYLRGKASFNRWTREDNNEALRLCYRAIEIDPDFASAYGMASWCYAQRNMSGWMFDRQQEIVEVARVAARAVELGQDDAVVLSGAGAAYVRVIGDLEAAAASISQALALNLNLAQAWYGSSTVKCHRGELDAAHEHAQRAMRLSPVDPLMFMMQTLVAVVHFYGGRYDEALSKAEQALRTKSSFQPALRMAVASSALLGRMEQAQKAMMRLLQLNPALRISNLKELAPAWRPEELARFAEGLRRAGMPE